MGFTLKGADRNVFESGGLLMSPVTDFRVFNDFYCCDPENHDDIDDFIRSDACRHFKDKVAVTYGLFNANGKHGNCPLGFATLQNDVVIIKETRYPYPNMPAVKIGRFGIRLEFHRHGLGRAFLGMIRNFMSQADNRTGCRYLTLSTYPPLINFYEKNNFTVLNGRQPNPKPDEQVIMYLSLAQKGLQRCTGNAA